jgi:hypothetical protein
MTQRTNNFVQLDDSHYLLLNTEGLLEAREAFAEQEEVDYTFEAPTWDKFPVVGRFGFDGDGDSGYAFTAVCIDAHQYVASLNKQLRTLYQNLK